MLDLQSEVQPKTIHRVEKLARFYPTAEIFFQDVIDRQVSELERGNFYMRLDIQKYVDQYNMSTEIFYAEFADGGLDDREDFMIWSGLYEAILKNEAKLEELA